MVKCTLNMPVAFYQNSRLLFGFACLGADGLWHGMDETGNTFIFRQNRFVLIGDPWSEFDPGIEHLVDFRQQAEQHAGNLQEDDFTWMGTAPHSMDELLSKLDAKENEKRFGVFLYLASHTALFQHKNQFIRLNSASDKLAFLEKENQKLEREQFLKQVEDFLGGEQLPDHALDRLYAELPFLGQSGENRDLQRLIAHHWPELDFSAALLQFRKQCGELSPSLDPLVASSGIPVGFAPGVLREELGSPRTEFSGKEVFTIDDADTRDYDDGISIVAAPEGWKIGIHVADVSALIPWGGMIYKDAAQRVSSFYAACDTVPMLPAKFSEDLVSLIQNSTRAVISLYADLDHRGVIQNVEIIREQVVITENLSYRQVDSRLNQAPFADLWRIAQSLKVQRDVPETTERQRHHYYFRCHNNRVVLKKIDHESPARIMVEEFMILFNTKIAAYATSHNIPVLYRNVNLNGGTGDSAFPSQAFLSTNPEYHPGIGSSAYLHATSPLRRFTDMVNHFQISSVLDGSPPPLTKADLDKLVEPIEHRLNLLKELAHHNERYWCMKYIEEQYSNMPLDAILKGVNKGIMRLEILPWGKQVNVHSSSIPREDVFKVVFIAMDWRKLIGEVDIL